MYDKMYLSVSRWKILIRSIHSMLISFVFFFIIFIGLYMGWIMHSEEIKSSLLNAILILCGLTLCLMQFYSILSGLLDIILKRYTTKRVYITNIYTVYGRTDLAYISTVDENGNFENYADTSDKFVSGMSENKFYNICASNFSKRIFRYEPTIKEFDVDTHTRRYKNENNHKLLNKLKIYEGLYGNELPLSHFITGALTLVTAVLGTAVIIVSSIK